MAETTIKVTADTRQAERSLDRLGSSLKALAGLAVGFFAAKGVVSVLDTVTEAAKIQEDAINALNTSLKISGQFSKEASESFQEYASSLQQATKFGDEAILQNAALIQSMGQLTNEALKDATAAALDLSAALGVDLATAANLVGKAAAGNVSSLSRYGIQVKKTGDAAKDLETALAQINKQFGGAAAAQVNTFSGATQQLSNTWGDLLEEFGFFITENPVVIGAVKELNAAIGGIITGINKDRKNLVKDFSKGFLEAIDIVLKELPKFKKGIETTFIGAVNSMKIGLNGLDGAITAVALGLSTVASAALATAFGLAKINPLKTAEDVEELRKAWENASIDQVLLIERMAATGAETIKLIDGITDALTTDTSATGFGKFITDLRGKLSDLGKTIKKTIKDEIEAPGAIKVDGDFTKFWKKFVEQAERAIPALASGAKEASNILVQGTKNTRSVLDEIDEIEKRSAIEIAELEQKEADARIQGDEKAAKEAQSERIASEKRIALEKEKAEKRLQKVQEEGAGRAVQKLGGAIGELFSEGAGQFVEAIIQIATDEEAFRVFIEGFTEALPEMIDAFVEAMPGITDALLKAIPPIVIALVKGFFESVAQGVALTGDLVFKAFNRVFDEGLPELIANIKEQLSSITLDGIKEFFQKIGPAFEQFFQQIINSAGLVVEALVEGVKQAFTGSSGGGFQGVTSGDVLTGGLNRAFGFADGGVIPPGFPRDSFPAGLTSGEVVLNAKQQKALAFDNARTQDMLAQVLQTLQNPTQVRSELTLDGKALGEVILDLNRDNARLA
jgi:hypothetical protein